MSRTAVYIFDGNSCSVPDCSTLDIWAEYDPEASTLLLTSRELSLGIVSYLIPLAQYHATGIFHLIHTVQRHIRFIIPGHREKQIFPEIFGGNFITAFQNLAGLRWAEI